MQPSDLPHALGETVVPGWPKSTLHVATGLPEHSYEPGFDAAAKQELLRAVAERAANEDLLHRVHWGHAPGQPIRAGGFPSQVYSDPQPGPPPRRR